MKLLIVFICALVLVAQSQAAPSNDEDRVQVQPEEVAVVDAGNEADSEGPQDVFAVDSPAVEEMFVDEAQEPQSPFAIGDPAERSFVAPKTLYLPTIGRACTDSACLYICNLLGFINGVCVSTTTCQCS